MAGVFPSNIITHERLPELQKAILDVKNAMHEDRLLTQAGHPDANRTKRLSDLHDKLVTFKSVYFPGQ